MKTIFNHSILSKRKAFYNLVWLLTLPLFIFISSCGGNENLVENSIENQLIEAEDTETIEISEESIYELIASFPSPIEMALIIKKNTNDFSSDMLLNPEISNQYQTSYDQALALGAYGSDMGYLNIYKKIFLIPDYLVALRQLSKELDLDNFFEFDQMMELAKNADNVDTLIEMSTESFNEMEAHLREKGRDELSVLIVFGTWLEGAYVIADLAQISKYENLYDRVALQKDFVQKLDEIFNSVDDTYFKELSEKIAPLMSLYDAVEIEVIIRESTMDEVDGQLVFTDNNETIIHAETKIIEELITETIRIRNNILN